MWYKLIIYLLLGIAILSILYSLFVKRHRLSLALKCIGILCLVCIAVLSQFPPTFASIYDAFHFMARGEIIHIIDAPHSACIIYETSPRETSYMVVSKAPNGYSTGGFTTDVAHSMSSNYGIMILCDKTKTDYFALGFYLTKFPEDFQVNDSLGSTFTYNKPLEKEPLHSEYIVDFYSYLNSYDSTYSLTISNHVDADMTIVPE